MPDSPQPEETEADRVRRIGRDIKDGIDLEHVHTMAGLVEVFQIAFDRAKRERDLDRELKKPFWPE